MEVLLKEKASRHGPSGSGPPNPAESDQRFESQAQLEASNGPSRQGGAGAGAHANACGAIGDIDEVVPIFRLIPGRCESSFGLACAQQAGMPSSILQRAKEVSHWSPESCF